MAESLISPSVSEVLAFGKEQKWISKNKNKTIEGWTSANASIHKIASINVNGDPKLRLAIDMRGVSFPYILKVYMLSNQTRSR